MMARSDARNGGYSRIDSALAVLSKRHKRPLRKQEKRASPKRHNEGKLAENSLSLSVNKSKGVSVTLSSDMLCAFKELERALETDAAVAVTCMNEAEKEHGDCVRALDALFRDIHISRTQSNVGEESETNEESDDGSRSALIGTVPVSGKLALTVSQKCAESVTPTAITSSIEMGRVQGSSDNGADNDHGDDDDDDDNDDDDDVDDDDDEHLKSLENKNDIFGDFSMQHVQLRGLAQALKKRMAFYPTGSEASSDEEEEESDGERDSEREVGPEFSMSSQSPSRSTTGSTPKSMPTRQKGRPTSFERNAKKTMRKKAKKKVGQTRKKTTRKKNKNKKKKKAKVMKKKVPITRTKTQKISPEVKNDDDKGSDTYGPTPSTSRSPKAKTRTPGGLSLSPRGKRQMQCSTRMASRLSALRRSMERMSMLRSEDEGRTAKGNENGTKRDTIVSASVTATVAATNATTAGGHSPFPRQRQSNVNAERVVAALGSPIGLDLLFEGTAGRAQRALEEASAEEGRDNELRDVDEDSSFFSDPVSAKAAASYARAFADGLRKSLEGPRLEALSTRLRELEERIQAAVIASSAAPAASVSARVDTDTDVGTGTGVGADGEGDLGVDAGAGVGADAEVNADTNCDEALHGRRRSGEERQGQVRHLHFRGGCVETEPTATDSTVEVDSVPDRLAAVSSIESLHERDRTSTQSKTFP